MGIRHVDVIACLLVSITEAESEKEEAEEEAFEEEEEEEEGDEEEEEPPRSKRRTTRLQERKIKAVKALPARQTRSRRVKG